MYNVCLCGDDENVTQVRAEREKNWKTSSPPATSHFLPIFPFSARENVVFMLEPCIFIYVGFFLFSFCCLGFHLNVFLKERKKKKRSDFIDFSFFLCNEKCRRFGGNCYGFSAAWDPSCVSSVETFLISSCWFCVNFSPLMTFVT